MVLKIYHSLDSFPAYHSSVLTIGTFDGVHLGHVKIIRQLVQLANERGLESVVLTFFPHPRMVLYPDDHGIKLINTLDEKIMLLEELGLDHLIVQPFTNEFSKLTAEAYMQEVILERIKAKVVVIGYDHRFGKNREGNMQMLEVFAQTHQIDLIEIAPQDIQEITISSTKVRNYLLEGDAQMAAKLLGRYYSLEGRVIHGSEIGRTIGFPTANIAHITDYKLMPADGVYAVLVTIDNKKHQGMMNIGMRPTVSGITHTKEVHIFNFNQDIYNQFITVAVVARIRDEQKFSNIEALKTQLGLDKIQSLALLNQ